MAKTLKANVHLLNPDTNAYEVFTPEDKLPSWATKALADKPHVFEGEDDKVEEKPAQTQNVSDKRNS